jgi:uncharacterized membrane protein
MQEIPLHPAIVHVPLGLSLVMPFVAAAIALALRKGWATKPMWLVVVALQAAVLVGGLVAMNSGEDEEETVEKVVNERFIEEHEERAEAFVWSAGITLALSVAVLVVGPQQIGTAAMVTALAAAITLGLGYRVGHSGGELVFKHGVVRLIRPKIGMRMPVLGPGCINALLYKNVRASIAGKPSVLRARGRGATKSRGVTQ